MICLKIKNRAGITESNEAKSPTWLRSKYEQLEFAGVRESNEVAHTAAQLDANFGLHKRLVSQGACGSSV